MKSKLLFPLIAGIFCFNNLAAQPDCFYNNSTDFCTGEKYYVYADAANVRIAPNVNSEIHFKLPAGQEIMIISIYKSKEEQIIDGLNGQWLFVTTTDEAKREGWIWSNTLSYKQLRRGATKFVFGIDKEIESGYKCTIKAVDNGKIVDRKNYEIGFDEKIFNNAKIIDNVFLENVKYVVNLCIGGGACAFGLNNFYFAWLDEKKKLVELPKAWSVSDACAVSYTETVYIPTENNDGLYNLLVKAARIGIPPENDDDACDYEKWTHEYKSELFEWNGKDVVKIKI